jgi:hypothetical protein
VFIGKKMAKLGSNTNASDALSLEAAKERARMVALTELDNTIQVPDERMRNAILPELEQACLAAPNEEWKLETLGQELSTSVRLLPNNTIAQRVYNAKVREIGRRFVERYPNWASLAADAAASGNAPAANRLASELVSRLVQMRTALWNLDKPSMREFIAGIDKLLHEHLGALEKNWDSVNGPATPGVFPEMELDVLDSLAAIKGDQLAPASSALADSVKRLTQGYKEKRQQKMLDFWRASGAEGDATLETIRQLSAHATLMRERFGKQDSDADDGLDRIWLDDVETLLVERFKDHERRAQAYWTPQALHGRPGFTLFDAAVAVSNALDQRKFEDRLRAVAETVKPPPLDDPLLNPNSTLISRLPRASKALVALRKLKSPASARRVIDSPDRCSSICRRPTSMRSASKRRAPCRRRARTF